MKRKSIAHIDWVGAKAGLDNYDLFFMKSLSRLGFKTFLCSNFNLDSADVTVKNVFNNTKDKKIISGIKIYTGLIRAMFFLKKNKVNWVVFNIWRGDLTELFSTFLSKLFGFKVLLIIHDVESLDTTQKLWLRRWVLSKFNDKITTHNQFSLDELYKIWDGARKQKIDIIHHGNYDELVNHEVTAKQGIEYFQLDSRTKYLLFFGQIKKAKGVDVLLNAMAKTKSDYKLIIAGKLRDDSWDTYQKIIVENDLTDRVILYIRHISDFERDLLFRLAYAVVLPYKLVYVSGVICWAFSFGKAVISSDVPPLKELIDDGKNAIIFPSGDSLALAVEIDNLVNGKYNIKDIQNAALEKSAKELSWYEVGVKYAKIFNQ